MITSTNHSKDEDGFVIVFVLMILAVVSIIGISASDTSVTEQQITRNDRIYKSTFYDADTGPYSVAKLVSRTIDEVPAEQEGSDFGFTLIDPSKPDSDTATIQTKIYRQIWGFDPHDGGTRDVSLEEDRIRVDIKCEGRTVAAGSSTEFASGAEGVGSGATGSVEINYSLSSDGINPLDFMVTVIGAYRKVPGIPGGL